MTAIIQRSFAGGYVGPELASRAEQTKYQTGLADCTNCIITRYGAVQNRPGFEYVGQDDGPVTLMPFVFSPTDALVLMWTEHLVYFIRDGAFIPLGATPAEWVAEHQYAEGDTVTSNGAVYRSSSNHTSQLANAPTAINSYWRLTGDRYAVAHNYSTFISAVKYAQSADVLTLVHPLFQPMELLRQDDTDWTLRAVTFGPGISGPTACAASGSSGTNSYRYKVTAVTDAGEESLSGTPTAITVRVDDSTPFTVTASSAHGLTTGDQVYFTRAGAAFLPGLHTITVTDATHFTLDGTVGYGGTSWLNVSCYRPFIQATCAAPTTSAPITLTWTAAADAKEYYVYREQDGIFGYIGTAGPTCNFKDVNYGPLVDEQPPTDLDPFTGYGNYPSCVTYFQQRLIFASSTNNPETVWMSRVGAYHNFTISTPLRDDDAVTFTMAGRQVNTVRDLDEIAGRLLVFTDAAVWRIMGGSDGIITPSTINPQKQAGSGSSRLPPVSLGGTVIYIQARGSRARDLQFSLDSDGYTERDLTIYCPGLFKGLTVTAIAYQEEPESVVWAVLSDGTMRGLTYLREHDIWAWHPHDTDGVVYGATSIPEGAEDAVYIAVKRGSVYMIERMASRSFTDIAVDATFMDSFATYDGRNATDTTMTLSGGTAWDETETLTCTASASTFVASNVGDQVIATDAATGLSYVLTIEGYTSGTVVTVRSEEVVPAALRSTAFATWALAVDTVSGLSHLASREVAVLADGVAVEDLTVSAGGILSLPGPASIVHVGLPYVSRVETLDAENLQGETMLTKRRSIGEVSIMVQETLGPWLSFGTNKARQCRHRSDTYGTATQPFTGILTESVDSNWAEHGRVVIEQRLPLPMTVLGVIPKIQVGG